MSKGRIISIIALLAIGGGFYAGYEFFLKKQFDVYSANKQIQENLQKAYDNIQETFNGADPKTVTAAWSANVEPWKDALAERSTYFTVADWFEYESPGEEEVMLRFWYKDKSNEIIDALYNKGAQQLGVNNFLMRDLRTQYQIPYDTDWAGLDVTREMVDKSMERLSFAVSSTEFFLKQNPIVFHDISIWPKYKDPDHKNLLETQRIGLHFKMNMDGLIKFVEQLRIEDRYITVETVQITYPYLAHEVEPVLDVQMVIAMAEFDPRGVMPVDVVKTDTGLGISTSGSGFRFLNLFGGD